MATPPVKAMDPRLVAPEVSNRLVLPFIAHIEAAHGPELAEAVLAAAGLPRSYLADQDGWVSSLWTDRFFAAWLSLRHGLEEAPAADHPVYQLWREVGRETWTRESLGAAYSVVRAMGAPGALYARLPDLSARGNKLLQIAHEGSRSGRCVVVVRSRPHASYRPGHDMVWNLVGLFEGLPTVWGLPPARVEVSQEEEAWRFEIQYVDRSLARPLLLAGGSLLLGVGSALAAGALAGPVAGVLGGLAGVLLVATVLGWRRVRELQAAIADDMEQMDRVLGRHDTRYSELHQEGQALRRSLLASRKLSGYLAQDLVDRILEEPELELQLGGQRTRAAVLFADIVGFTPRCEPLPPEQVVEELNTYFAYVDPTFEAHGGIIDKRMGDGIMTVFLPRPGEPPEGLHRRAVGCGLDMLRALGPCNLALAARGAAPIQIRVGIAAGALVQGNMGSELRLEYTVVGDTVNLAARLEGEATPGHVLVQAELLPPEPSEETGPFEVVSRSTITVKGKQQAVDVVEISPG